MLLNLSSSPKIQSSLFWGPLESSQINLGNNLIFTSKPSFSIEIFKELHRLYRLWSEFSEKFSTLIVFFVNALSLLDFA